MNSGPITGCDAQQTLAWIYNGGGLQLYQELLTKLGLNAVGFFAFPMPTQPLGWFKNPVSDAKQIKGLKYRTVGLAADLFQQMGARVTQLPGGEIIPAMEKGVIEAFEYNNPTSDSRFGAQDTSKNYMMGSFHQAMEFFEIIFNKKKWDTIPKDLQAILQYGVEAASASNRRTVASTMLWRSRVSTSPWSRRPTAERRDAATSAAIAASTGGSCATRGWLLDLRAVALGVVLVGGLQPAGVALGVVLVIRSAGERVTLGVLALIRAADVGVALGVDVLGAIVVHHVTLH